jgi:branched-chain amino acid transport system substrate-binding protein
MLKKLLIVVLVVAVVVTAGLVFAGGKDKDAATDEYPEEIAIGITAALSGGWAGFGVKPATGFELAADDINANGGIKNLGGAKIRVVKGDDQGIPERALAEAERLIVNEEIAALVGIWPTETPIASQCERYSVPGVFPLGVAAIHERGYKFVFKNYSTGLDEAEQQMNAILEACEANNVDPPKTVYMAYISDDASITNAAGFREQCEIHGIEIIGDEVIEPGQPSYASLLSKIERAKPDLLYSCHYAPDAIVMYTEIMERELYFPYGITGWGGGAEDIVFYDSVKPEAYAYMWVQENGDPMPWRRPWYDFINDRVEEKIGISWTDSHFVSTYCAMWQIKDALERVEWSPDIATFRDNLRQAIAETNITMENGERIPIPGTNETFIPALDPFGQKFVRYDEDGLNEFAMGIISQNIDGVRWPVYPEEFLEPGGPKHGIVPLPEWSERKGWTKLIVTEEDLQKLLQSKSY